MIQERILEATVAAHAGEFRPRVFDLSKEDDAREVECLLDTRRPVIIDRLRDQLAELVATRAPEHDLSPAEVGERIERQLGEVSLQTYGRWVFFPWSGRLVHLLPPDEFRELRTDRNRYRITPAEQTALRAKRIGVVGLSVGQAAAVTMALEGVGASFRLADFDVLGLSNLNRLRAGVHDLGLNKAILATREMFELDPYLDIVPFVEGVTEENLDRFLLEGGKLDLLVEECDDLYVKVRLRERARALGIPVVMETSEGGMIDIERFDREPDREVFHGLVPGLRAASLKGLSTKDKVPFVLAILGLVQMSARTRASLIEIRETLSTWPQIASAVVLGGALVTDVARRILLGQLSDSGRYYVDLERLVAHGAATPLSASGPQEGPVAPEALVAPQVPVRPSRQSDTPTLEDLRYMVAHAILAPSAGNAQPWRFVVHGEELRCYLDATRSGTFADFEGLASHVAVGAAVENLCLAAEALGFQAHLETTPRLGDARWLASVTFARTRARAPELFAQVVGRATNRKLAEPHPLRASDEEALMAAAGSATLTILADRPRLEELGRILGACDRLRFLSPVMHREFFQELRWTSEEVLATRDGMDLATLELSPTDRAILKVLSSPDAIAVLRDLNAGRALAQLTPKTLRGSSAVALLTVPGNDATTYFMGGRTVQRIWLTATQKGLAVQPLGAPYLFARLERGTGYTAGEAAILADLRRRYRALFELPHMHAEVLLFRLAYADPPTVRTLRRPLADVLQVMA
jgi:molybdopterin/thiamine biosynthesis adenylyltransferase